MVSDEKLNILERFGSADMQDLCYELREARSEIARHHRDFAMIRAILDGCDKGPPHSTRASRALAAIRNIVG